MGQNCSQKMVGYKNAMLNVGTIGPFLQFFLYYQVHNFQRSYNAK